MQIRSVSYANILYKEVQTLGSPLGRAVTAGD